ncbi:unnamed protein product [Anisakis simplex]|uniref:Transmembrane protein 65 (inferred by orthology to a human protein) n=1 Tax=Anisakis simplex TaxID=6269 RepID=A0A0M3KD46_ANISI|nr:unnamed protein product [Anisakis simplex]
MNRRVPSAVCVKDMRAARAVIANLSPDERIRLQNALMDSSHSCTQINLRNTLNVQLSREQSKQLFIVNTLPFIGFGFLDNFLMIVAAEYIEHSLGMVLAVSTMAAAGLGHIVADLAGIGLTHYVEYIVSKLGVKRPVLTAEQLHSSMARKVINLSRTFGLVIGCLIGMFPLLFYKDPKSS